MKARILTARETEILRLNHSGSTLEEIGRQIGVTRERVRQILVALQSRGHSVATRDTRRAVRAAQHIERLLAKSGEEIVSRLQAGENQTAIARALGTSNSLVARAIRRLIAMGLTSGPRYQPTETTLATWDAIRHHRDAGASLQDIADKLGISKSAVSSHVRTMRENGILSPKATGPQPDVLTDVRRSQIVRKMLADGARRDEIAEALGIGVHTLARLLRHMRSYRKS